MVMEVEFFKPFAIRVCVTADDARAQSDDYGLEALTATLMAAPDGTVLSHVGVEPDHTPTFPRLRVARHDKGVLTHLKHTVEKHGAEGTLKVWRPRFDLDFYCEAERNVDDFVAEIVAVLAKHGWTVSGPP